ncbi:hypothetical protein BV20DRAFT_114481 [Pilatotrama ljubarskyi]|nr:hypothetical protein BV20DRAFT_114481 [Pilatotrama ljubarskyi]
MNPLTATAGSDFTGLELGDTFGAMLVSTIIVAALYGVTVLQSIHYYHTFPKDSRILKMTVAVVWVFDMITVMLDAHAVYYYLIVNYNNPSALTTEVWSARVRYDSTPTTRHAEIPKVELVVTYTVVLIVQIFFILRIYRLRPYGWYISIPILLGLMAVASYALLATIGVRVFKDNSWGDVKTAMVNVPIVANWVLGMAVDIGITVTLCWYLWSEKIYVRRKTHRMLNRVIIFSVNRGAIAAVIQIMTLLTKFIWPQNLVWLAFHNALSKVYANSMLATLNSRAGLRDMIASGDLDGTELTLPSVRQDTHDGKGVHDNQVATLEFATVRSSTVGLDSIDSPVDSIDSDRLKSRFSTLTTELSTIQEQKSEFATKI